MWRRVYYKPTLSKGTTLTFLPSLIKLSGLENREHGRKDPSRWPRGSFYPQKLAQTSPKSGGRSVGIVRSRTQATELQLYTNS
jgi:hypothetical protein